MTKLEELDLANRGLGCLGKSQDDEPVFILCARDPVASIVVRTWATLSRWRGVRESKIDEAMRHADRMDTWLESKVMGSGNGQ